jgi:hypothetical protein
VALLRRAVLLAALVATGSCYEPRQPVCAFSCAADGLCPSGFTCGSDGVCHRDDSDGVCDIGPQIDAGDAGTDDGAPAAN